jgi:hypothetical protein
MEYDKCDFCNNIATVGIHGLENSKIKSDSLCESCYLLYKKTNNLDLLINRATAQSTDKKGNENEQMDIETNKGFR